MSRGGRTKKVTTSQGQNVTSVFVGSLFEKVGSTEKKYVYLGSRRVAAVNGEDVSIFLDDHLGSVNVITDDTERAKEIIEYKPYGEFARHDFYGGGEEVANFYFTGQRLDDEVGLYYYGARYYDSSLGRFITPDTIVQDPSDPQTLNRYSYCGNNPINRVDLDGHKWSWKKFWNSFAGAALGAIATIVTLGAAAPLWVAGMVGGFVAGAVTGGLEGGWKGALYGGLIGGALGGIGGWAGGLHNLTGNLILGGMLAGGIANTAATGSWDSFAGGITGAITGTAIGVTFQSMGAPGTPRNQRAAMLENEKQNQKALSVKASDNKQLRVGSRDVKGTPFDHMFAEDSTGNITEMGPGRNGGKITVFNYNKNDRGLFPSASLNGDTPLNTMTAIGLGEVQYSATTTVSQSAFSNVVSSYQSVWSGQTYVGGSFNSNYAVNSWVYGSGGNISGLSTNRPSFAGQYYQGR